MLLLIIILCLSVFGFFYLLRLINRKTAVNNLLTEYREEVYRLIAEIDAATDRDSLLVEERIKTLKKVIEDTDRRISFYVRETQKSRNSEAMYASLGQGIRVALESRPSAEEAAPEPKKKRTRKRTEKKAQQEKPKLKIQIAEMSVRGLSPSEIAANLNISPAEVNLALNLMDHSGGSAAGISAGSTAGT